MDPYNVGLQNHFERDGKRACAGIAAFVHIAHIMVQIEQDLTDHFKFAYRSTAR